MSDPQYADAENSEDESRARESVARLAAALSPHPRAAASADPCSFLRAIKPEVDAVVQVLEDVAPAVPWAGQVAAVIAGLQGIAAKFCPQP